MDSCNSGQKAILSILSTALFSRPLELPETLDWNAVLTESVSQAVFPLVYSALRDQLTLDIKEQWEKRYLQAISSNIRVFAAHSELHRHLSENGIPYVILKGCASARFYPKPELRTMGDVDFLVAPDDLVRCAEILERIGMRRGDDGTNEFHWKYFFRSMEYEMHWSPVGISEVNAEKLHRYYQNVFERSVCADGLCGSCYVPSDFHHGLTLLLHTAAHMTTTGIGLRHLCDWAVFVEQFSEESFCKSFEDCLKETGLWEFAKILTAISTRFLGGSRKPWTADVSDDLLDSLMEDTWHGGNFGKKDPQRFGYRVLMTNGESGKVDNRGLFHSLLSAIHRKAKIHYPKLAANYVLLPLAWTAICWKYTWRVLTKRRPWMKLGKDTKAAKQRRELFSRLKLFED